MKSMNDADLLIITPPAEAKNKIWPPYGAMYIASALRDKGRKALILDIDRERISNEEIIDKIKKIGPMYIGFSGIVATSYKFIKELSIELRRAFPDKIQILGGGLALAPGPVFGNTAIDIIVYGEGDITIVELLEYLEKGRDLEGVRGIYYKDGKSYRFTGPRPLFSDLDKLSYPAFDLIDMDRYLVDGMDFIRFFCNKVPDKRILDKRRKRRMINIITNRGCFGSCSFCSRPFPGLRMHSIKYILDFMEHCIGKFNVGFFSFGDECFATNKARNWEFINEYRKRKLDVIFRILGMRVDTVDRDILKAYKDIGCWKIAYGIESGSQKMLNIIDKKVTVEQNRQVLTWTREAGIYTPPQLILGMPGETKKTISETIDFMKSMNLDFKQYKWTYAFPVPGSALYDFAGITGIVSNEDAYLSSLVGDDAQSGFFHVNLTDEDDATVKGWSEELKNRLDDHYFRRKYNISHPALVKCMHFFESIALHFRRKDLFRAFLNKISFLAVSAAGEAKKTECKERPVRFKRAVDIKIEKFLEGMDFSSVNKDMSLRKINELMKKDLQR